MGYIKNLSDNVFIEKSKYLCVADWTKYTYIIV